MRLLSRLCCVLVALVIASLASAFPVIWTKTTTASTEGRAIYDTSGNFYHVTRSGSIFGRQLTVTKYNALGTILWASTYSVNGNLDTQFNIRSLAVTATKLIVVAQERAAGGTGALVASVHLSFDASNGGLGYTSTSVAFQIEAVAGGVGQYAVLRRNTTTGSTEVVFFDELNQGLGTQSLGITASIVGLAMDANNFAYAACSTAAGTVQVSRCDASTLTYQTNLDVPLVNNERPTKVVVDSAANRVYALGFGEWHQAPNDYDITYYAIEALSGNTVLSGTVLNTTADDEPGDIAVVPGAGFIANGINTVVNETVHRRFNAQCNVLWTHTVTGTPAGTARSTARDADGNYLLLSSSASIGSVKVARVGVDTGHPLGTQDVFIGNGALPLGLLSDAAGNFYITADTTSSTHFLRVQPANLTFSGTNVAGGSTVTATITLAVTAMGDQDWVLSSSNPAVASVPGNLNIGLSNITGSFPITIHPVTVNTNVSINVRHNGFIAQRIITVIPSVIHSVAVAPQVVVGGTSTMANLNLTGTAPAGGRTVNLASNKPAVASVPASVNIPAGQSTLGVQVTTFGVNSNQGVVITATTGAVSKTAFFAVNAPSLSSIGVSPGTVQGGATASMNINLNGIAPTGGFSIALFSGAPGVVFLPVSSSVPAGQASHALNVPTAAVVAPLNVTLFATRSGIYKTTTLSVTP